MGMMQDKDVDKSISLLIPIAKTFYTATPDNIRSMPAKELAERIRTFGASAEPCGTVAQAVHKAMQSDGPSLAVGSLYMAGEVHEAFRREPS